MLRNYIDREHAGKHLAKQLAAYANDKNAIVLGLPRGGVPVANEIAKKLNVPMDVFLVRKIGMPGHEELAIGAIAAGGVSFFNKELINAYRVPKEAIDQMVQREQAELERREKNYRGERVFPGLANKKIILVDDGIATGATIRVAISALEQLNPGKIIVAVPVASKESSEEVSQMVDEFVCPLMPDYFAAVGQWYQAFGQTTDEEVIEILNKYNYQ